MHAEVSPIAFTAEASPPWGRGLVPPELGLGPLTPRELHERIRGGEVEADLVEALAVWASRARGALDLALAEGLYALERGDRLVRLGYHLTDYGREVLDLGETTTRDLAKLGAGTRERPLLREALASKRIGLRAAEIVLPVAKGDDEAVWVERAARSTVRALEAAVCRARAGLTVDEDEWFRIRAHLPGLEQQAVDLAFEAAGRLLPGATRFERLEAIAQEFLGEFARDAEDDAARPLGPEFRRLDPGNGSRRAALELQTERWAHLPSVPVAMVMPDVRFDDTMTAHDVDRQLRALAKQRRELDDVVGWCAHTLKRAGIPKLLGFSSFRHYVEERLGLPPRAVEQREALEERLWKSPALREAKRHRVGYEKLRALSKLPEQDVASWIPRAKALTVIALRRRIDGERERQMRAARRFTAAMPRRVAVLLAAAVELVRERAGCLVPLATCLAEVAAHFVSTWKHVLFVRRSRAQEIRGRDLGQCQAPGCSRRAADAHHVVFRSRGGSDDATNQVGVCEFHHHRCIHGGTMTVEGTAPDRLRWFVNGQPFDGRPHERYAPGEPS